MTYNLAVELGPKGVRVNGIVPGSIEGTPGMDKLTPKEF
jgi:NAD(P)-dependent dehydrogenase (short-subunit alcohol dehydrogenase family)